MNIDQELTSKKLIPYSSFTLPSSLTAINCIYLFATQIPEKCAIQKYKSYRNILLYKYYLQFIKIPCRFLCLYLIEFMFLYIIFQ